MGVRFLSSAEAIILFYIEAQISGPISGVRAGTDASLADPVLSQSIDAGLQTVRDADANLDYLGMHGMSCFHFHPSTPFFSFFWS